MKKGILGLAVGVIFTMSVGVLCFAEDLVINEQPYFKMVIEGQAKVYENLPINVNNSVLLPFREVLTSLGVPNDDQHIIWNQANRTVNILSTIDGKEVNLQLKIDDLNATINNKPATLEVAPMLYNDRTYVPVRFLSESLGKTVVWDAVGQFVMIKNTKDFEQVKEIVTKSNDADKDTKRIKYSADIEITTPDAQNIKEHADGAYDLEKKTIYSKMTMTSDNPPATQSGETYIVDNMVYYTQGATWAKVEVPKEVIATVQKQQTTPMNLALTETASAGLQIDTSAPADEIWLKGNVYLPNSFAALTGGQNAELPPYLSISKSYIEIVLDKKTYLAKKATLALDIVEQGQPGEPEQKVITKTVMYFSEYNGKFEITLPKAALEAVLQAAE
ncbi:MAG: copper amine oxidase N-terminal domain-containing protein [Hyphomonadaceae bacterium]|nr:copper amine oxidase N-terminal domain-containing protein [Clostridia bacterium]